MLLPERIVEQLQNKLAGFRAYDGDYQKELAAYQKALAALSQSDAAALHDKLDGKEEAQAEAFARNLASFIFQITVRFIFHLRFSI